MLCLAVVMIVVKGGKMNIIDKVSSHGGTPLSFCPTLWPKMGLGTKHC